MAEHRLSIGDFSTRSQLSPKALRLYDEIGLVVPAHVDPSMGYRWYAPEQLDRARQVALLRFLQMPVPSATTRGRPYDLARPFVSIASWVTATPPSAYQVCRRVISRIVCPAALAAHQLVILVVNEAILRSRFGLREVPAEEIGEIVDDGVEMWLRCYRARPG